ncbi:MAG: RecQ family ATP-dependent DNA helicase [Treponema sp.]|jgi:ATP-dependent DNA helicase RecQ|nr:RecQ family ATP-dependent DNA helicase [Treponema sp.]
MDADPLNRALNYFFSLPYLYPYQRLVIANLLEAAPASGIPIHWPGLGPTEAPDAGEDRADTGRQLVILPTGAGKSLCFQLPAMVLGGITLLICPLLSLMADQERRLREKGFVPALLRGGQSREERETIWHNLRSGKSKIIIANPETLLRPATLSILGTLGIAHLVIDEAHCVSEWGETFRPAYQELGKIREALAPPGAPELLITAFTATASPPVLEKIERYIFGPGSAPRRITGNPDRNNIRYAAQGAILRDLAVRDLLRTHRLPALVFCASRWGTEQLARYLRYEAEAAGRASAAAEIRFYHAGLSREEKKALEDWFFTASNGVLVATCAYGMGVDKPNIRTVIHRDCPPSVEAYLQESGRAGRDALPARGILLWGPDDAAAGRKTPAERQRFLLDYARNIRVCRRRELLRLLQYEGDGAVGAVEPGRCCDVCAGEARDACREEAPVLDFIRRNRRSYCLNQAAALIAGDPAIGCGEGEGRVLLQTLITMGKITASRNIFWKDALYTKVPAGALRKAAVP